MKHLATSFRRAALAAVLTAAAMLAGAAPANAGTYTVHTCKTPQA